MSPKPRSRVHAFVIFVIAASIASAIGSSTATVAQEPLPEACAFQERTPQGVRAIDPNCETHDRVACTYHEDVHGRVRTAHVPGQECPSDAAADAASAEAQEWPDYDSTAISDPERNIAIDAARIEAAGWPDYDSTAISDPERNIAIDAARIEAAGWPDYDSTAISDPASSTDVAEADSNEVTTERGRLVAF